MLLTLATILVLQASLFDHLADVVLADVAGLRAWVTDGFQHLMAQHDLVMQLHDQILARAGVCLSHAPQILLVAHHLLVLSLGARPFHATLAVRGAIDWPGSIRDGWLVMARAEVRLA